MVDVRVRVNRGAAIAAAIKSSTGQRAEIAGQAVADAQAEAPVLTGDYRGGMTVEVTGDKVSMVDTDPDAFYKELGTSDTPAHASLITAASRYGFYKGVAIAWTRSQSRKSSIAAGNTRARGGAIER